MRCVTQKEAIEVIADATNHVKGLVPIVGLPRSGKSTLIYSLYNCITKPRILVKSGEFDCYDVISGTEKYTSLRLRLLDIINIMRAAKLEAVILVDSIKDILYDGKSSMRIGGISNDAIIRLNELNILCKQANILLIGAISTSTINVNYNQEIASIIAGSSVDIVVCRYDYSVALDIENKRSSILEISSHLVISPDIIDSKIK